MYGWLCVNDVALGVPCGVTCVWHCGWNAENPALGTTGVQTLLDALPAAAMKVVIVSSAYHPCRGMHGYVCSVCLSRMALVVHACRMHWLNACVGWVCACTPCAWHVADCGIQGRLSFAASSWSALEQWHCRSALQLLSLCDLYLRAHSSMLTPLSLQQTISTGADSVPSLWQSCSTMLLCCRTFGLTVRLHAHAAADCDHLLILHGA